VCHLSVILFGSGDGAVLRLLKILVERLLVKVEIERLEWCPIFLTALVLCDRRLLIFGGKITRSCLDILHVTLCLLHNL